MSMGTCLLYTSERPPDAPLPHTAFVNQWRSGDTLLTLRELLDLAEEVGPTIARRAELGHTELKAIELLVRSPHCLLYTSRCV